MTRNWPVYARTPSRLPARSTGWFSLLLAAGVTTAAVADNYVTFSPIGPAFTSGNAASFIHHNIHTVGDQQFVAYYNDSGNVTVARRTLGTDDWDVYSTSFTAYNIYDGHDVISFGIDGDGYMHMSWGMHGDPLQYAKSTVPVTGTGAIAFTGLIPMTGFENTVTYPQFYELPSGDLLFLFREITSGDGDTYWSRYDVATGTWSTVHGGTGQTPFFKGTGWNPDYNLYTNLATFDSQGTLHLTGTIRYNGDSPTGHGGFQTNHDVFYFRSFDEAVTWERMDGTPFALPISEFGENGDPNTMAERVLTIPEGSSLINQGSMTIDNDGHPIFATYWAPEAASGNHARQYMIGWYDGVSWHTSPVTNHVTDYDPDGDGVNDPIPESQLGAYSMGRPAVLVDDENRVFLIYSDYHRGNVITAAWSEDRVNWSVADLTNEDIGGWEPTIDMVTWRAEHKAHLLYSSLLGGVQTAQVLTWDAAAYIADPPDPPVPGPGDVLFADTFATGTLGDPFAQSGVLAPAAYARTGPGIDVGGGDLRLNRFDDNGSAYVSPIIDLGTPEIAAAGGYMITMAGIDPVVDGTGADSDWAAIAVLRDSTGGTDPIVLDSPYGVLLRDTGNAEAFKSGAAVFQQTVDPTPPGIYTQRIVVEYQSDAAIGDARVSTYVGKHEAQTLLYAHDFNGAGDPLNGTAVDVGAEIWQAGAAFRDDGSVETVVAGSPNGQAAFLPFTPQSGQVYALSVEIENPHPDWIACGFLPATPPGGDWTATSYSVRHSNNGAYAWVLTRDEDQQGFNGPSTSNGAFGGSIVPTSAPVDITIILDTNAATWTVEYRLNGTSQGLFSLASGAAGGIGGVGFSRDRNPTPGTGGVVRNLTLTASPGTPTPPGSLSLVHATLLSNAPLSTQFFALESRNEFSSIDELEVRVLVPGDTNLDGAVDGTDAAAQLENLGAAGDRSQGEFTLDGHVDMLDLSVLQTHFGFSGGP